MKIHFLQRHCVLLMLLSVTTTAQPKIQLDRPKIDLGTIYHGETKTVKFVVSNAGDQPLNISNIETSCGCTSAIKNVPVLEPGRADTIEVSFNSMGFDGKIRKEIMVYSNDPTSPMIGAMFSGTVVSELESVPKMTVLNLGASPIRSAATASFLFRNTSQERIIITGITCADTSIAVLAQRRSVESSDTVTISITYTPRSAALIDRTFHVQTTSPRQPRIPFRFLYAGQ